MKFKDKIHVSVLIKSGDKAAQKSFICGKELTLNEDDPVLQTCYEKTTENLQKNDMDNIHVIGFVISVYVEPPK
jgi:hypothetical protein